MAVADKYQNLIDSLYEQTSLGALDWQPDFMDGAPTVQFPHYRIKLTSREDGTEPFEVVTILGANGNVIDEFDDTLLKGYSPPTGQPNYYIFMLDLRQMANRKAKGAEKAIDDILSHLTKG